MERYEPKLFNAANNIFKEPYEYTRGYRAFVRENFKNVNKEIVGQMSIDDYVAV